MYLEIKNKTMYENNNIHNDSLQIGMEFQDFVVSKLIKELGMPITLYGSKKFQFNYGENFQGVEIKYDARSTGDKTYYDNEATNNVAIEIMEKSDKNKLNWIPSGIYRNDNSWLYIVGNYNQFWIFGKSILKLLHESDKYRTAQTLPTIKTMLLPLCEADKFCLKKMTF